MAKKQIIKTGGLPAIDDKELLLCEKNIIRFVRQLPIEVKDKYKRMDTALTVQQRDFLRALSGKGSAESYKFYLWIGSKGSGKSMLAGSVYPLWQMLFGWNWSGLLVSATKQTALEHLGRIKRFLESNPALTSAKWLINKDSIIDESMNNSLKAVAANEVLCAAIDADYIHIDEADKITNKAIFEEGISAMGVRNTKIAITGNAITDSGWKRELFDKIANRAEFNSLYYYTRTSIDETPWICKSDIITEIADLCPSAYRRYYLSIDEDGEAQRIREVRKIDVGEKFGAAERRFVKQYWSNECAICGEVGTEETPLHIDHWKPLARGHALTMDNAALLCPSCNCRKSDKMASDVFNIDDVGRIESMIAAQAQLWVNMDAA